ncbi:SDR family NAD(P)-dependent oxidoreductase [Sphingomonas profundi]|uniref:SDR family NAD(P)-dependent oxidoreductase n=1 Tax=Alterirhizorhabdus profundi TaxID=2681549 RepID=UPI0012E8B30E|nr:SDR family NAD(P)-dependent oxidoreductase [Sphingomonas profundi]
MTGCARTWLVTGAASGLGAAIVAHALACGDRVVACARSIEAIAPGDPSRLLALRLDVNEAGAAEAVVAAAIARFGRIDVLVNNAGFGVMGTLEETPQVEYRAIMETNFFGLVEVTRAVLPSMRAAGGGIIVNVSSVAVLRPRAGFSAYAASKAAVEAFSDALGREVASFGIGVLIVEPGALKTGFTRRSLRIMPRLPAYSAVMDPMRERVMAADGHGGDARRAAAAIDRAIAIRPIPVRLQLGRDAQDAAIESRAVLMADLVLWRDFGILDSREN